MPKVFFRTADSKAFTKEIESEVNYDKALESIVKVFNLPKNKIRLKYCCEIKTKNFTLDPQIPGHIIHIVEKSEILDEEITVSLKMNNGPLVRIISDIKTKLNTQVKDFLHLVLEESGINEKTVRSKELFHRGVKLD